MICKCSLIVDDDEMKIVEESEEDCEELILLGFNQSKKIELNILLCNDTCHKDDENKINRSSNPVAQTLHMAENISICARDEKEQKESWKWIKMAEDILLDHKHDNCDGYERKKQRRKMDDPFLYEEKPVESVNDLTPQSTSPRSSCSLSHKD